MFPNRHGADVPLGLEGCLSPSDPLQPPRPLRHGIGILPAQLVLPGLHFSIPLTAFSPLGNWLSRSQEHQADRFAAELNATPESLASALVKMSSNNLSNLHPHPLYAAIYYSHPPVVKRVQTLTAAMRITT